jgi:site-specific recombinase XerC
VSALNSKRDIRRSLKPLRDRAIVHLLKLDLTTAQVARLQVADVDTGAGMVMVPVTCGGKVRRVPVEMDAECATSITKWMAVRPMVCSGVEALFVTLHANRPAGMISDRSIRSVLADWAAAPSA